MNAGYESREEQTRLTHAMFNTGRAPRPDPANAPTCDMLDEEPLAPLAPLAPLTLDTVLTLEDLRRLLKIVAYS
ncbi:MAG: hypothetical protein G8237_13280 [Magnetococcales bacterium]|nr:hypothetical protein [Magnetococcales bacterium]NGZ07315.1 hypothetical protein [Magnetococcales bacterium]